MKSTRQWEYKRISRSRQQVGGSYQGQKHFPLKHTCCFCHSWVFTFLVTKAIRSAGPEKESGSQHKCCARSPHSKTTSITAHCHRSPAAGWGWREGICVTRPSERPSHLPWPHKCTVNDIPKEKSLHLPSPRSIRGFLGVWGIRWKRSDIHLEQWNCPVWHCDGGYMSSYICPNAQNVQQQDWTLMSIWTLGDNDVPVQAPQV